MATFAQRLTEAMSLRRMKAVDLSDASGVGKSDISNYMKGKYKAKQDKLFSLARVLDVSEAWLMGEDVPRERAPMKPHEPVVLTALEHRLIDAFRAAEDSAREYALDMLVSYPKEYASVRASIRDAEQRDEKQRRTP